MSCLHRACCLSRGKHSRNKHKHLIPKRGTEDKRLASCRCAGIICSIQYCTYLVTPTGCLTACCPLASSSSTFDRTRRQSPAIYHDNDQGLPLIEHHKTSIARPLKEPKASTSKQQNVLPQVHPLPEVHHARPASHPRVSQERGRRHFARHLLRELQSHSCQRQRSLPVLLAGGQA